jgi:hypothetical protein
MLAMTPIKLSIAMKIPIPKKDIVAITANNKKNGFTFFKRLHPFLKTVFSKISKW